jgi:hypothetical protein
MKTALWVVLMASTVALAGCTDNDAGTDSVADDGSLVDLEKYGLGNKGAISGLLVDDEYRPVQLKQDWGSKQPGDFQDVGFMLLLETGTEIETTANGEFQVLDLEPGSYTLRTAAEGHEAIDKTMQVQSGEFTEITVEARRKASSNSQILTQEYAVFVDCWIPVWTELNCFGDMSLDSKRAGFTSYMEALRGEVSYIYSEFEFAQAGDYDGDIGKCNGESFSSWGLSVPVRDSTYGALWVVANEERLSNLPDDIGIEVAGALKGLEFCTVVWPQGEIVPGLVGFGTSTKARIMQSAFIGEPETDLSGYCVICPPE